MTDAAAKAGAAIMAHYGTMDSIEYKDDDLPVTKADRDADAILLAALHDFAPSISVVSEETVTDRKAPLGRLFFWSIRWMAPRSSSRNARTSR